MNRFLHFLGWHGQTYLQVGFQSAANDITDGGILGGSG